MREQNKSNQFIAKFLFSTTFALILLMGVTLLLSYLIRNSPNNESLWKPVFGSTIGFMIGGALYYFLIKVTDTEKYFM